MRIYAVEVEGIIAVNGCRENKVMFAVNINSIDSLAIRVDNRKCNTIALCPNLLDTFSRLGLPGILEFFDLASGDKKDAA